MIRERPSNPDDYDPANVTDHWMHSCGDGGADLEAGKWIAWLVNQPNKEFVCDTRGEAIELVEQELGLSEEDEDE